MLEKCITRALSPDTSRLTTSPPSRFFKMLEENPLRAWYGESHVFKAAERGAIGKLLVSDELFRCVWACCLRPLRHSSSE